MPVYIHSAEAISPQHTFQTDAFLLDPVKPEKEYFTCQHPDYKQFINAGSLRRMSKVIRMGLATAKACLEQAGTRQPDAILIGSGLGCMEDTAKFLNQLIENNEQLLNPTAFIQSTHNTVSGQIALMLGCRNYNLTFSQKSISFETALLDAMLRLREPGFGDILVGGLDEIVDESFELMVQSGCVKRLKEDSRTKLSTPGAFAGEGATFFMLSDTKTGSSLARLNDLEIINRCPDTLELKGKLENFLARNGLSAEGIDLVVSGANGDDRYKGIDDQVNGWFEKSILAGYKHLVGEFDTASAFGLFLGARIIRDNSVPDAVRINRINRKKISKVLVYNHSKGRDFSFILLSEPNN
jgi:3-oxoacyl-[acyl-carrier-protein] synthase II